MNKKLKLKKGDEVIVITGKDKGKKGNITKVLLKESRLVIKGVNMVTKHVKPSANNAGGLIRKEMSIHISNVAYFDSQNQLPSKIGYKFLEDKTKVRFIKRSNNVLNK